MTAVVDCHSERSRHFLDLVDDELDLVDDEADRGELEEASNKLWGAAAHAIKVVAEHRQGGGFTALTTPWRIP